MSDEKRMLYSKVESILESTTKIERQIQSGVSLTGMTPSYILKIWILLIFDKIRAEKDADNLNEMSYTNQKTISDLSQVVSLKKITFCCCSEF